MSKISAVLVGIRANISFPETDLYTGQYHRNVHFRLGLGAFGGTGPSSKRIERLFGGARFAASLNLLPGMPRALSTMTAADRADAEYMAKRLKEHLTRKMSFTNLVLCGADVCRAFGVKFVPFTTVQDGVFSLHLIPHPSGRNRLWNTRSGEAEKFCATVAETVYNDRAP